MFNLGEHLYNFQVTGIGLTSELSQFFSQRNFLAVVSSQMKKERKAMDNVRVRLIRIHNFLQ